MRRTLSVAVTLIAVLAIASPAIAKGPQGATLSGPGIDRPIVIEGSGEYATGTYFSSFVEATGFWQLVFAADFGVNNLGILAEAPTTELGEPYTVTWHLGDARVEAILYPNATGGSLTQVEPDVWISGFQTATEGGWFRTTQPLGPMLEKMMSASTDLAPTTSPETPAETHAPAAAQVPDSIVGATGLVSPTTPPETAPAAHAPVAAQGPGPIARATGSVISSVLVTGLAVAGLVGAIWTMRKRLLRAVALAFRSS